ncbi:claudin-34 isoform X1 [Hippocampus comes]|uniref:claudin-34 isoform X1 n=2 Tax=Hippocampus comes TaxID=109280 RepID=UPI00094F187A|nr:PREDICTED: claudin-34 isoform X1 [Hippocampus comes]
MDVFTAVPRQNSPKGDKARATLTLDLIIIIIIIIININMLFLAHTGHWQFLGLLAGCLAWILTMATTGMDEWRLWHLHPDNCTSIITSGVAWVGIWRACFHSHALPKMENCQTMTISDRFVPVEIRVAQVLMALAMLGGLAGNAAAVQAVRRVYFTMECHGGVRAAFILAGALYLFTAALVLVPLVWNASAVVNNATIPFPPRFGLPDAPAGQQVGTAVRVGFVAAVLMIVSGLLFLAHRHVWRTLEPELHGRGLAEADKQGRDNPAFHADQVS